MVNKVPEIDLDKKINFSYKALLGENAWLRLHPAVQKRFSTKQAYKAVYYRGVMDEIFLSGAGKLLAQLCRLIGTPLALYPGRNISTDVHVYPDHERGGMTWDRYYFYPGRKVNRVKSTKIIDRKNGLIEVVGGGFGMTLRLIEKQGALYFISTEFFWSFKGKKITIPKLLTPGETVVGHNAIDDNRFIFSLKVTHPFLGLVFRQIGCFQACEDF